MFAIGQRVICVHVCKVTCTYTLAGANTMPIRGKQALFQTPRRLHLEDRLVVGCAWILICTNVQRSYCISQLYTHRWGSQIMAAQKGGWICVWHIHLKVCHLCNGDRYLNVNATLLTMRNCYLKWKWPVESILLLVHWSICCFRVLAQPLVVAVALAKKAVLIYPLNVFVISVVL